MNREIKFRGKRIDTGEWVYGYPSPEGCGQFSIGWIEIGGGNITNEGDYECWHSRKVDPSTISQYTGLKDKNGTGTETYESDIVLTEIGKAKVVFNAGCFMLEWIDDKEANMELLGITNKCGRFRFFEVIGNIHENPELLT